MFTYIYTVYIYAHPCTVGIKPPISIHMAVCQNLVPLVNIKIAGKWMYPTKNGINRY